jgi:peptidoglycan/LPS O-acetylase OafA/YrhL
MRVTQGQLFAGRLAVQGFFVLSGFLVATSWLRLRSVRHFAVNRILRLGPGLLACLVFTAFVVAPAMFFLPPHHGDFLDLAPSPLGYVWRNLVHPGRQPAIGGLLGLNPYPGVFNGSLWTLFYEAACYASVAALGLAGFLSRFRGWWLAALALLLVLHPLSHAGLTPLLCARLFDTEGKCLCLHFACGMAWAVWPEGTAPLGRPAAVMAAAVALAAGWTLGFGDFVSPVALPMVLFWLGEHLPLRNMESRLHGDYSYGLYLYGFPMQQTLAALGLHRAGLSGFLLLSFAVTAPLAIASWHWIEQPARRLRTLAFRPVNAMPAV